MIGDRTNAELEAELRRIDRGRRFLAPAARPGNGHGYLTEPTREAQPVADPPEVAARIGTATSIFDEPEAPSPAWVDAEADLAATRNALRHAALVEQLRAARQELSLRARIADARRRARAQHVDVSHQLHLVERDLQRAQSRRAPVPETATELRESRRDEAEPPAALRRMQAVEALLDGPVTIP